jgi:RNA polymerase sigma factor (TIGR02999 family)
VIDECRESDDWFSISRVSCSIGANSIALQSSQRNTTTMSDVTLILERLESGETGELDLLFSKVYNELHRLAVLYIAQEKPGQTLQATALVHEAYLRLVDDQRAKHWDSRRHFFAAAAEAMRRILVERARKKQRLKRGGVCQREQMEMNEISAPLVPQKTLIVHEALDKLQAVNSLAAELVKLRFFVGFTIPDAARALAISPRKADQVWAYARAWLLTEIGEMTTS